MSFIHQEIYVEGGQGSAKDVRPQFIPLNKIICPLCGVKHDPDFPLVSFYCRTCRRVFRRF